MLHVATSHLCFFQFSHPKCNGNLSVTYERHNYSFSTPLFYVLAFKTEYALVPTCKRLKSRTVRWAEHLELMGEERGVYRFLVGKQEGRRPLGRPRRRWVDNITMDLQEVGCGYMDWIGLAQDRDRWRTLVSAVMNLRVS